MRAYEVNPSACGDYWVIQLFQDGEEVGGGKYPSGRTFNGIFDAGYQDALDEGEDWIGAYLPEPVGVEQTVGDLLKNAAIGAFQFAWQITAPGGYWVSACNFDRRGVKMRRAYRGVQQ